MRDRHELASARSGWVSSACSVNVPVGPEEADAQTGAVCGEGMRRRRSRAGRIVTWTSAPCGIARRRARRARRPDDAVAPLRRLPFADLGFARVDHHRALRQGMAEAVYGPGKTPEQCAAIVAELLAERSAAPVLLTAGRRRRRPTAALDGNPGGPAAPAPPWCGGRRRPAAERVVVVTAGTADLPVADECAAVLERPRLRRRRAHRRRRGRRAPPARRAPTSSPPPTRSSWSPAWRARWPASSAASPPRRSSPCRPASATAPSLEGVTALLAMLASCAVGRHRGRHRQRLRRGVRRRPAPRPGGGHRSSADAGPTATPCVSRPHAWRRRDHRLVPLLLGHRRRHGARRAHRRRRRPRRGARHRASGCRSAAGSSRPSPCCAAASAARRSTSACRARRRSSAPRRTSPAWSRRPACPDRVRQRAQATFGALAEAEGRLHRRPPEPGALPRGRRHRRHRRRRRHVRRARGARRRRGLRPARSPPASAWSAAAHGTAPQPVAGRRRAARGAPRPTRLDVPVELTTPTGAALLAAPGQLGWGPMPADAPSPPPASAPAPRRSTAAQPHPGRARRRRTIGRPRRSRSAGGAARGQRRRRHRRDAGPRHRGAARGRRPRRLDHPDPHEEGPARPTRSASWPTRRWPGSSPRCSRPRPARSACGAGRSSAGPRPARLDEVEVDGLPVRVKVSRRPGQGRVRRRRARRSAHRSPLREVMARAEASWRTANEERVDVGALGPHRGSGATRRLRRRGALSRRGAHRRAAPRPPAPP